MTYNEPYDKEDSNGSTMENEIPSSSNDSFDRGTSLDIDNLMTNSPKSIRDLAKCEFIGPFHETALKEIDEHIKNHPELADSEPLNEKNPIYLVKWNDNDGHYEIDFEKYRDEKTSSSNDSQKIQSLENSLLILSMFQDRLLS